jgi:CMP-N,N'-diacetyllegionaminic acid synthase
MAEKPHVVAIIAARGGSKGLPRKNVRVLAGKPLIAWTIEAAKASPLVDRVIMTTDDAEIAEIARKYGAEVPFMRPAELAQDLTPTEPVLTHALDWVERVDHYPVDIVVFLQPTDLFRRKTMIDEVVQRLIDDPTLESAFVAYPTHKNYWRKVDGRFVRLVPGPAYGPRQKKEPIYREDTGLACATRASLIREGQRLGERVDIVPNPDEASFIDIHNDFDFWLAEKVITEWGRTLND